jgi:PAS domain S-box-containing protein
MTKSSAISGGIMIAPGFSSELALECLASTARSDEVVSFVLDWSLRQLVHVHGSLHLLLGVSEEDLMADPTVWRHSLTDYDRGALMGVHEELAKLGAVSRSVNATGGDGVMRSLLCTARLVKAGGRAFVCGSVKTLAPNTADFTAPSIMREAVEHAREGLAVTDPAGNFVYLNKEHVKIFGYNDKQELIGKSWRILYAPEEVRFLESCIIPELVQNQSWAGQLKAQKKDGSIFYEYISLSILPNGGIICNCRDVSEQFAVAKKLQHSEELFRAFLNTLQIGVMIRKVNGGFEFLNSAMKRIFSEAGTPQIDAEMLSKCAKNDPVFGGAAESDRQVAETGESAIFDYTFTCGGRTCIYEVEKHALYLNNSQRSHVCTLVHDVTRQRQLEDQAGTSLRRSEEYHAMQRDFIGMVSHEFRTPLTSIQGLHYLLSKKSTQLPPEFRMDQDRLLRLQAQALSHLKELVDQVLLINRLENSTQGQPLQTICLVDFVQDLIDGLNLSLAAGRLRLVVDVPASYSVECDPDKIRAAIQNLVSNAVKYSTEDTEVLVTVSLDDQGWQMAVADRGRGIPREDQAKIFEPFHRASNVNQTPGTGLGLAIVQRVVDYHRGSISLSSAEGEGTVFTIKIPANPRLIGIAANNTNNALNT